MNERDTTLLNDYFNGLLSADEARALEARAETDAEFGAEFNLRREMEAFPRHEAAHQALKDTLTSVGAEYFKEQKMENNATMTVSRSNIRRWMALAAALTLVAAAIWFFKQPGKPEVLETPVYAQYAHHQPLSLTVMGDNEQLKVDAETAFANKDYSNALLALNQLIAREQGNVKIALYRGICYLEMDKTFVARTIFINIANGNSALKEEANWYIALSFLKENNLVACKATLEGIGKGQAHYEEAQRMLKGL